MAQKYMISKALIPTSTKGFTVIELLVGLIITAIVGGLALDAIITASGMFSNDKRDIDTNQNLSAILEIIGNDIKQSGELIGDANFPVIEIQQNPIYIVPGNTTKSDSSTITIRRALTNTLTLCAAIPDNDSAGRTKIVVSNKTDGIDCSDIPAVPAKPAVPATGTAPAVAAVAAIPSKFSEVTDEARNYRCKLGYPMLSNNTTILDFCTPPTLLGNTPSLTLQNVRGFISDNLGHTRSFKYIGDDITTDANLYKLETEPMTGAVGVNNIEYKIGSSIHLVEERKYTLDANGNLTVSVDGRTAAILARKIDRFKVSAKINTNTTDKTIKPSPDAVMGCPTASDDGIEIVAAPTIQNPQYACKVNSGSINDWKTIAGVKIELQARYDATGKGAIATAKDRAKISVTAEFFPRNVLSK